MAFEQGVGQGELLWFFREFISSGAENSAPAPLSRPSVTVGYSSASLGFPQFPVWSKSIVTLSVTG